MAPRTSSELILELTGGYYFKQVNRLVGALRPLFRIASTQSPAVLTVDLSRLTFIGPAGLTILVATLHQLREASLMLPGSSIAMPRAIGPRNYLHRIDFYKRVLAEEDWPDFVTKSDLKGTRPCQSFLSDPEAGAWSQSLRTVTEELLAAIEELVRTDEAAHSSLNIALSEVAENVGYHADTPHGGFAAVQHLPRSREIELAICDRGVGIAASLRRNPRFAPGVTDDLRAIQAALKATVTSTPWRNSGYGLTFTQLLLALNGGRLLVRSGRGHVLRGDETSDRLVESCLPGTLVGMRLRTDRPLDFQAAYSALDEAIDRARLEDHGDHE